MHKVLIYNCPVLLSPLPFPHTLSILTDASPTDLLAELHSTTILITVGATLSRELLTTKAPHLQAIISPGTGVDFVDFPAVRERGITLINTPAQNVESVSEHAFALLGALKRRIVPLHALTVGGEWARRKKMLLEPFGSGGAPRTNAQEVLGVVGYGNLGKHVQQIAVALGMKVLVAERKGEEKTRQGRTPFETVLRGCTVLVITAPLDESTRDMISTPELEMMDKTAMIVNVGRGAIVNEAAAAQALKDRTLGGLATDVFEVEPVGESTSPLLHEDVPNLVVSPHIAWYSSLTLTNAKRTVEENVKRFVEGNPQNVVISGIGPREI